MNMNDPKTQKEYGVAEDQAETHEIKATGSDSSITGKDVPAPQHQEPQDEELHRTLTERQVGMIAIG